MNGTLREDVAPADIQLLERAVDTAGEAAAMGKQAYKLEEKGEDPDERKGSIRHAEADRQVGA